MGTGRVLRRRTRACTFVGVLLGTEYEEALRYPHLQGLDEKQWDKLAKTGKPSKLSELGDVGNMDEPGDFGGLDEDKKARFQQNYDAGNMEMPIVIKQPYGTFDLLGGNTRQAA